jgi:hypothetical protein
MVEKGVTGMFEQRGLAHTVSAGPLRAQARLRRGAAVLLALLLLVAGTVLLLPGAARGATIVAHAATANPTCGTGAGFSGDDLTGCVQATPAGLTFTWTGYTDYSSAEQYVEIIGVGTTISQNVMCSIPTCSKSFALAAGEYTGHATLVTGTAAGGTIPFDLVVSPSDPWVPQAVSAPIAGMAATPDGEGYWEAGTDGNVYAFGDATSYGSLLGTRLNKPVVGIAATPDGKGYWLVASDGGIFSFGDARFYGSAATIPLQKPVVGMAVDRATGGYWLVASDGGIFSFNAPFYGSTGNIQLVQPIVGMAAATDGGGYRFVAQDGGVFDFGQPFSGSLGGQALPAPIVGMASNAAGGYWLVGSSATVTAFGGAAVYPSGS